MMIRTSTNIDYNLLDYSNSHFLLQKEDILVPKPVQDGAGFYSVPSESTTSTVVDRVNESNHSRM